MNGVSQPRSSLVKPRQGRVRAGFVSCDQDDAGTHLSKLFRSNLADASTHGVKNMPVLLAGGGFKHGRHLAFDPKSNPPLCNLYVSMLQRLGLEVDKFGSSTGTLTGLEALG